ncbi:MAG: 50S ribosomal protein L21 [Thermomicrobiales bacterium]
MAETTSGYAIIETGGKQYRVAVGDTIIVEKLDGDAGDEVTFEKVLLVGGEGAAKVGAPYVDGASVTASLDGQGKGDKIVVFKYKPKKRYRRRIGHRQLQSELTITAINA